MIIADNIIKFKTTLIIMEVHNIPFEVGLTPSQIKSESYQSTRCLNLEAIGNTDAKS